MIGNSNTNWDEMKLRFDYSIRFNGKRIEVPASSAQLSNDTKSFIIVIIINRIVSVVSKTMGRMSGRMNGWINERSRHFINLYFSW